MPSTGVQVAANPVRIAQFSYQLIVGCVADIIPLSIRLQRNSNDQDAARQLVALFMNRLFQARDSYYESVTQGMLQGCSGLSLMIGFDNPWAVLLRKQCEAVPISLIGLYDMVLSVAVDVPITKCLCVDARETGDFKKNAVDKCYHSVPTHMKPLVVSLIENSENEGDEQQVCAILVNHTISNLKKSLSPWFDKQFQASAAIASSFDYLLRFFDVDAGRCMDFQANPFATVLIPEPYDYFAACGATTLCEQKCSVEVAAFESATAGYSASALGRMKVTDTTVTSMFFNDLDEDALMPMRIVTIVELSSCVAVCGGTANDDMCAAVAGIAANNTIQVKKYCIPSAVGLSVRSAPSQTWNVWGSEDWTISVTDIQFADTIHGDTLVLFRDGHGQVNTNLAMNPPPVAARCTRHPSPRLTPNPTPQLGGHGTTGTVCDGAPSGAAKRAAGVG
jgi:hypothetical protein